MYVDTHESTVGELRDAHQHAEQAQQETSDLQAHNNQLQGECVLTLCVVVPCQHCCIAYLMYC